MIALALALAAACGDDAGAAAVTACSLVTQAEGAEALGEAVNEPVEQIVSPGGEGRSAVSQCTLQATATAGKTLTVFLTTPMRGNQSESVRGTLVESGIPVEDVSGIGEGSLWSSNQLHVFVPGELYLIVTVRGPFGDSVARARATRIARQALARAS
jgi:hypothetical protein